MTGGNSSHFLYVGNIIAYEIFRVQNKPFKMELLQRITYTTQILNLSI